MFRAFFLSFFLSLFLITPLGFSDPAVDVSLAKTEIYLGESTDLRIQFRWPKDEAAYTFAVPTLMLQNLTVINQAESQETFLQGNKSWTQKMFTFQLSPKEAGEGEVGSFSIGYVNPATGTQGQIAVSALKIHIKKTVPTRNISPLILVLSAVILGSFVFAVFYHRRKQPKNITGLLEPNQAILIFKEKIQGQEVFSQSNLSALAQNFWGLLNEVYTLDLSPRTEAKLVESLREKGVLQEEIKTIKGILSRIQEAKYTGQNLSSLEFQALKKEITVFIDSKQIHLFSSQN